MNVLITLPFSKEHQAQFQKLPFHFSFCSEKESLPQKQLEDISILMCYNPFDHMDLAKMKALNWIQLSSIGIDHVPKEALIRQNIRLCNNNGGYKIPIAEWIVFKILEYYKNGIQLYERQKKAQWHLDFSLRELTHKNILFVGTGNIATETAKRLAPFDVRILGINQSGNVPPYFNQVVTFDNADALLAQADIIVLSVPLTPKTHHMVNPAFLEKISPHAFLINISRGDIIDEEALTSALREEKLAGCALDVFSEEPLPQTHAFWQNEKIRISAHNSWVSEFIEQRRFELFYENLSRYEKKLPLLNTINLSRGY